MSNRPATHTRPARRVRVEEPEEHENHERWLITYADMITLLMVLFIVLFAMSQVDQKKFNALREGLAAGFGQSTSILDGSSSILSEPGTAAVEPIAPPKYVETLPEVDQVRFNAALADQERQRQQRRYAEAAAEANRLLEIERRLRAALGRAGLESDVRTLVDGNGLTVSLVSEHVVFDANLATLAPRGRRVLEVLAPVLRTLPDPLRIEGHTNQVPVKPKYYATDWDLSAARGVTVLRFLNERGRVPAARLSVAAYGAEKPLVDPRQPGSQALNKRVDIVVLSALTEENQALLTQVMRDRAARPAPTGDADTSGTSTRTSTGNSTGNSSTGSNGSTDRATAAPATSGEEAR